MHPVQEHVNTLGIDCSIQRLTEYSFIFKWRMHFIPSLFVCLFLIDRFINSDPNFPLSTFSSTPTALIFSEYSSQKERLHHCEQGWSTIFSFSYLQRDFAEENEANKWRKQPTTRMSCQLSNSLPQLGISTLTEISRRSNKSSTMLVDIKAEDYLIGHKASKHFELKRPQIPVPQIRYWRFSILHFILPKNHQGLE